MARTDSTNDDIPVDRTTRRHLAIAGWNYLFLMAVSAWECVTTYWGWV